MCDTCGCGDRAVVTLDIQTSLLAANDRQAAHNREQFRTHGVLALNLMGSPGSGKTALLEVTAQRLAGHARIGALAGDLVTGLDASRLRAAGVVARAIATGTACHLDGAMVHRALHDVPLERLDYIFIENVGNLVCPAVFDLGQAANVVALSVVEGTDKPLKYPPMFRKADVVVLTKVDLLPHLPEVKVSDIERALSRVMPVPRLVQVSARTGEGLEGWLSWLAETARLRHPHG